MRFFGLIVCCEKGSKRLRRFHVRELGDAIDKDGVRWLELAIHPHGLTKNRAVTAQPFPPLSVIVIRNSQDPTGLVPAGMKSRLSAKKSGKWLWPSTLNGQHKSVVSGGTSNVPRKGLSNLLSL